MLQSVTNLEHAVRKRRNTDKPLINWWLYALLLSWVTFGVAALIIHVQRMLRRDRHFARINTVFAAALRCTKEFADLKRVDASYEIAAVERLLGEHQGLLRPKGVLLWLLLTVITLGFGGIYVVYYLTVDWYRLQCAEQDIMNAFSKAWLNIGITKYPVTVDITAPRRTPGLFWLYIALSVVTFGLWGFFWDYSIHTVCERVFKESERWEQTMLDCFRHADTDPGVAALSPA